MQSNESTAKGGVTKDLIQQLQEAIETTFSSIILPFEGVQVQDAEDTEGAVRVRATITFEGDLEGHVLIHCSSAVRTTFHAGC